MNYSWNDRLDDTGEVAVIGPDRIDLIVSVGAVRGGCVAIHCLDSKTAGELGQKLIEMSEFAKAKVGEKEGDKCGVDGCDGTLTPSEIENCSCHISPPCPACVNNTLECDVCGNVVE